MGTHKLEGKLADLLAFSCGYDCRIVFAIETEQTTGEKLIILLDIGTHAVNSVRSLVLLLPQLHRLSSLDK